MTSTSRCCEVWSLRFRSFQVRARAISIAVSSVLSVRLRKLAPGLCVMLSVSGTAIIVSHDRWFLDRLCTHILAFEGTGSVVFFDGNYSEYEVDRERRLGSKFNPSRIHYKKLGVI